MNFMRFDKEKSKKKNKSRNRLRTQLGICCREQEKRRREPRNYLPTLGRNYLENSNTTSGDNFVACDSGKTSPENKKISSGEICL